MLPQFSLHKKIRVYFLQRVIQRGKSISSIDSSRMIPTIDQVSSCKRWFSSSIVSNTTESTCNSPDSHNDWSFLDTFSDCAVMGSDRGTVVYVAVCEDKQQIKQKVSNSSNTFTGKVKFDSAVNGSGSGSGAGLSGSESGSMSLVVDFRERAASRRSIIDSPTHREKGDSDEELLAGQRIARILRPSFHPSYLGTVQVTVTVHALGEGNPTALAVNLASLALLKAGLPWGNSYGCTSHGLSAFIAYRLVNGSWTLHLPETIKSKHANDVSQNNYHGKSSVFVANDLDAGVVTVNDTQYGEVMVVTCGHNCENDIKYIELLPTSAPIPWSGFLPVIDKTQLRLKEGRVHETNTGLSLSYDSLGELIAHQSRRLCELQNRALDKFRHTPNDVYSLKLQTQIGRVTSSDKGLDKHGDILKRNALKLWVPVISEWLSRLHPNPFSNKIASYLGLHLYSALGCDIREFSMVSGCENIELPNLPSLQFPTETLPDDFLNSDLVNTVLHSSIRSTACKHINASRHINASSQISELDVIKTAHGSAQLHNATRYN
jgi:ribonuclease PH